MKTKSIEQSKAVWVAVLSLIVQLITFFQGESGVLVELTGLPESTLLLILSSTSIFLLGLIRIFDTDSKIVIKTPPK